MVKLTFHIENNCHHEKSDRFILANILTFLLVIFHCNSFYRRVLFSFHEANNKYKILISYRQDSINR